MKLIKFRHHQDFGNEWYIQILNTKNWSILQTSVSWNDFPSWPYLQITFGSNGLFSILFWAYKFGLDVYTNFYKLYHIGLGVQHLQHSYRKLNCK